MVGGSYIASEFASIFNGLGAQVIQIHRGEKLLAGLDYDMRSFIASAMIKTGVNLQLKTQVEGITTFYRSDFKALKHTLSGSTERTLMKLLG